VLVTVSLEQLRAEGCMIPATWCEAHHQTPWASGGRTDLDDATQLCSHHHRAHDTDHHTDGADNGELRFTGRR
jgi:hypothetical protein